MKKFIVLIVTVFILFSAETSNTQQMVDNCLNYLFAGDYQRAISAGLNAVKLYPENADAHFCLGQSYISIGELDKALISIKYAERFTASKSKLNFIYNRLGLIYHKKGDLENALLYYSRSLLLCRKLGDTKGEAACLNNVARILHDKGELDKALDYYEQSLKLTFDVKEKATIYNNMALIYTQKKDYQRAIQHFKKAIDINERAGNYHGLAIILLNLGETYREIKDLENALKNLNNGLEKILKVGDKYWEAVAYKYLGWLYGDMGDIKIAKGYLSRAYELCKSIGAESEAADALFSLLALQEKKKKNLYAGIEIGSKGVKAMIIELSEADEKGFYNINEKMRRSVNTTIISGVAETGMFRSEAIEETAKAVKELMDFMIEKGGIQLESVFIAGSSSLAYVKNREELAKRVKELTSKDMVFVSKDEEIFYGIVGSIPDKYQTTGLLIDIGSGNIKIGYLEADPQRIISFELPYGTVSLTELSKKINPTEKVYAGTVLDLASKKIRPKLKQESFRKPSLTTRQPVFILGGIVWAMSTIFYPERQESFVKLTGDDINRFYNFVVQKKYTVFNVNLSRIKDSETRIKAEKQLQAIKDTFTQDDLIAGATILKTLADELKLKGREVYFARNGSWLWGYLAYAGMEKFE